MRAVDPRERNPAKLAEALSRQTRDRSGTVTLTANAASTTVYHQAVTVASIILLVEETANAAAAKYASPYCLVTPAKKQFVIAHANNAQTDRTFAWIALGD